MIIAVCIDLFTYCAFPGSIFMSYAEQSAILILVFPGNIGNVFCKKESQLNMLLMKVKLCSSLKTNKLTIVPNIIRQVQAFIFLLMFLLKSHSFVPHPLTKSDEDLYFFLDQ